VRAQRVEASAPQRFNAALAAAAATPLMLAAGARLRAARRVRVSVRYSRALLRAGPAMAASAAVSDEDLQAFGVMMGGAAVVVRACARAGGGAAARVSRCALTAARAGHGGAGVDHWKRAVRESLLSQIVSAFAALHCWAGTTLAAPP